MFARPDSYLVPKVLFLEGGNCYMKPWSLYIWSPVFLFPFFRCLPDELLVVLSGPCRELWLPFPDCPYQLKGTGVYIQESCVGESWFYKHLVCRKMLSHVDRQWHSRKPKYIDKEIFKLTWENWGFLGGVRTKCSCPLSFFTFSEN